jgi:gluconolactonase
VNVTTLFGAGLAVAALCAAFAEGGEAGGKLVSADPEFSRIVPANARIEKLADGFQFTEGPVWSRAGLLLFSDIPNDVVLRWEQKSGKVSDYRRPSGQTNGNTMDAKGRLVSCEHVGRRVSRREKDGSITTLADRYEGRRLNSPNDVVFKSDGALYFTDPPYGLPKQDEDPAKELIADGVYRLKNGHLTLLTDELKRPNGLAFSPDEKTLYVANSDEARKIWMAYPVERDGRLGRGRLFYDVTASKEPGLPDGMKVDREGNLFCTAPGGVWVFSPDGRHLGTIAPPEVPANCAWGDDGHSLYMTAQKGLYRIRLTTAGKLP